MAYLSRQDLKNLRAEAVAGALFAPSQVLELLDEIDRLNSYIAGMQRELDHRALVARVSDRRREPRMAQTLENLQAFTEAAVKKERI